MFAWLRWVDATFSPTARTRRSAGSTAARWRSRDAHPLVRAVLARCERLRVATGGYFDARAGGPLDPSGLVKGWAVDRAAALLEARRVLHRRGRRRARARRAVAGRRAPPAASATACAVLAVTDAAVATSGAYERGAHVARPGGRRAGAGRAVGDRLGRELATADAYATAAFAMGERGPAWTARLRGYEAMTMLEGEPSCRRPASRGCGCRSTPRARA